MRRSVRERAAAVIDAMSPVTTMILMRMTFWISDLVVFSVIMLPVYRFIHFGWAVRKQEFTNRIKGKKIANYLGRFWEETIAANKCLTNASDETRFSTVYDVLSGRNLYIFPAILLAVSVFVFGSLAIEGAVRTGYESYVQDYLALGIKEGPYVDLWVSHLHVNELDTVFFPVPPLMLDVGALAAVAGAYLAVSQIVITGYKTRSLLSSDLMWASFRLIIAIPLGYAVSSVAVAPLSGLVSFGLGALPMSAIIKLLRRLTGGAVNAAETADHDDLLQMVGVTPDVAALLNEEGIYSPQQLSDGDPVSLAVRTGLAFNFVLNLAAESLVWSAVGATAALMAPLGCADARIIRKLFVLAGSEQDPAMLAALSKLTGYESEALKEVLLVIAKNPMTEFLANLGDEFVP